MTTTMIITIIVVVVVIVITTRIINNNTDNNDLRCPAHDELGSCRAHLTRAFTSGMKTLTLRQTHQDGFSLLSLVSFFWCLPC